MRLLTVVGLLLVLLSLVLPGSILATQPRDTKVSCSMPILYILDPTKSGVPGSDSIQELQESVACAKRAERLLLVGLIILSGLTLSVRFQRLRSRSTDLAD
jgi:hypothetical protein